MKIHIDTLETFCIIGLLDFERDAEQRVLLDIEIDYIYEAGTFLDYSKIVNKIEQHLKQERYFLLEDALMGIKTLLFRCYPTIALLKVKISKPDILAHCSVGLAETWVNKSQ